MIPVLFITYNRLEYSKISLAALLESDAHMIFIIDNGSTDGTKEWLVDNYETWKDRVHLIFNESNDHSIAKAMNMFLERTKGLSVVGKIDNDTVVPKDFFKLMRPYMQFADIIQAKHPLLPATHPKGFDDWVKNMPGYPTLKFHHFVGGSGVLFDRRKVHSIPDTEWAIGGWRQFQRVHPELKKAFVTDVEIKLLDTTEEGADYSKYPDYYRKTGRTNA